MCECKDGATCEVQEACFVLSYCLTEDVRDMRDEGTPVSFGFHIFLRGANKLGLRYINIYLLIDPIFKMRSHKSALNRIRNIGS